jgi:hypothetical protein
MAYMEKTDYVYQSLQSRPERFELPSLRFEASFSRWIDFFHIDGVIRRSATIAWRKTGKAGNMALFTMAANDRPS